MVEGEAQRLHVTQGTTGRSPAGTCHLPLTEQLSPASVTTAGGPWGPSEVVGSPEQRLLDLDWHMGITSMEVIGRLWEASNTVLALIGLPS